MERYFCRKPFFPFKNRLSKSYGPYRSGSVDVKTGSPDPADFATTRPLIRWRVLAIRAMFGRPLANDVVTAGSGRIKICQLWHIRLSPLANCAVTAAICQQSTQPLRELSQSVKLKPSHGKIHRIWTTSCTSMDVVLYGLLLEDGRFLN
jgi:hypothetical protein